jgi:sec-independent protein translocase protein TatB
MFGIGWTEMLLIGVVALIVIGPKDLPVVMNRLGKAVNAIRRMGSEFQREINKATGLDEIRDLRKSITEPLKQTAAEIRNEFNKPLPGGGFAPSGAIKPKDPELESVVDEIHAKLKMEAEEIAATEAVKPAKSAGAPRPVESPAPVEAIAPAKKPRAPRKPKSAAPAEAGPVVEVKPAAKPRKPRAAKPKAEA